MSSAPMRATAAYGQAAQTIPPLRQLVMLYDGAISRLRDARHASVEGRIEDRFMAVRKASMIVDALHACLDFDRGGEIANLLDRLYSYIGLRMQQINTRDDPRICDELIAHLTELRDAWLTIINGSGPLPTLSSRQGAGTPAAA